MSTPPSVSKLIGTLLALSLAGRCAFGGISPVQTYTTDCNAGPESKALTFVQNSSQTINWYFQQGPGTNALTKDLTNATSVRFTYRPVDAAWTVTATGSVLSVTGGLVTVSLTPAQLATNSNAGDFQWRLAVSSAAETLAYAYGKLSIIEDFSTGAGALSVGTNINWAGYSGYSNTASNGPYRAGLNITFAGNADGSVNINGGGASPFTASPTNTPVNGYVLAVTTNGTTTNTYWVVQGTGTGDLAATNTPTAGQMLYASDTNKTHLYFAAAPAGGDTNAAIVDATNRVAGVGYLLPPSTNTTRILATNEAIQDIIARGYSTNLYQTTSITNAPTDGAILSVTVGGNATSYHHVARADLGFASASATNGLLIDATNKAVGTANAYSLALANSLRDALDRNERNDLIARLVSAYGDGWDAPLYMEQGLVDAWANTNNINASASSNHVWSSGLVRWQPYQLSGAPTAYWTLDDNAANTVVVDSMGFYNGKTTNNTSTRTTTGKIGAAFAFEKRDAVDEITVPGFQPSTGTNTFTVAHWFKSAAQDLSKEYDMWAFGDTTLPAQNYVVCEYNYTAGTLRYSQGSAAVDTSVRVDDGLWHFGVLTFNGTTAQGWIDATNYGSGDWSSLAAAAGDLYIGGDRSGTRAATGTIDNVVCFSRVLSGLEITNLYNGGVGTNLNPNLGYIGGNIRLQTQPIYLTNTPVAVQLIAAQLGVATNVQYKIVCGAATNTVTMTDVAGYPTNSARVLTGSWTNMTGWSTNPAIRIDTLNNGYGTNYGVGIQWRYW